MEALLGCTVHRLGYVPPPGLNPEAVTVAKGRYTALLTAVVARVEDLLADARAEDDADAAAPDTSLDALEAAMAAVHMDPAALTKPGALEAAAASTTAALKARVAAAVTVPNVSGVYPGYAQPGWGLATLCEAVVEVLPGQEIASHRVYVLGPSAAGGIFLLYPLTGAVLEAVLEPDTVSATATTTGTGTDTGTIVLPGKVTPVRLLGAVPTEGLAAVTRNVCVGRVVCILTSQGSLYVFDADKAVPITATNLPRVVPGPGPGPGAGAGTGVVVQSVFVPPVLVTHFVETQLPLLKPAVAVVHPNTAEVAAAAAGTTLVALTQRGGLEGLATLMQDLQEVLDGAVATADAVKQATDVAPLPPHATPLEYRDRATALLDLQTRVKANVDTLTVSGDNLWSECNAVLKAVVGDPLPAADPATWTPTGETCVGRPGALPPVSLVGGENRFLEPVALLTDGGKAAGGALWAVAVADNRARCIWVLGVGRASGRYCVQPYRNHLTRLTGAASTESGSGSNLLIGLDPEGLTVWALSPEHFMGMQATTADPEPALVPAQGQRMTLLATTPVLSAVVMAATAGTPTASTAQFGHRAAPVLADLLEAAVLDADGAGVDTPRRAMGIIISSLHKMRVRTQEALAAASAISTHVKVAVQAVATLGTSGHMGPSPGPGPDSSPDPGLGPGPGPETSELGRPLPPAHRRRHQADTEAEAEAGVSEHKGDDSVADASASADADADADAGADADADIDTSVAADGPFCVTNGFVADMWAALQVASRKPGACRVADGVVVPTVVPHQVSLGYIINSVFTSMTARVYRGAVGLPPEVYNPDSDGPVATLVVTGFLNTQLFAVAVPLKGFPWCYFPTTHLQGARYTGTTTFETVADVVLAPTPTPLALLRIRGANAVVPLCLADVTRPVAHAQLPLCFGTKTLITSTTFGVERFPPGVPRHPTEPGDLVATLTTAAPVGVATLRLVPTATPRFIDS
jgi:hypothetical protein